MGMIERGGVGKAGKDTRLVVTMDGVEVKVEANLHR